ncbi:glycoside hydrolase superfamily, partial [Catenaria anguillulae PL171]
MVMAVIVCGAITMLSDSSFASAAASGSPTMIAYWGQSKSSNLYQDAARTEQSLSDFCKLTQFTHVHLAYLRDPFAIDDLPGIDFSKHCSFPNDVSLSRYKTQRPVSGFAPLFCPSIRDGIQACQEKGKKVLLTISPVTSLGSDDRGRQFANTLWNLFFGGQHSQRPFGARKLDGIELALRTDQYIGYGAMIQELKRLAGSNPLTVTVSPRCDFPDALFGPTYADRILTSGSSALSLVDNINVHFLSSTSCSLIPNPDGFQRSLNAWIDFAR